jgi:hypothetical protein
MPTAKHHNPRRAGSRSAAVQQQDFRDLLLDGVQH